MTGTKDMGMPASVRYTFDQKCRSLGITGKNHASAKSAMHSAHVRICYTDFLWLEETYKDKWIWGHDDGLGITLYFTEPEDAVLVKLKYS